MSTDAFVQRNNCTKLYAIAQTLRDKNAKHVMKEATARIQSMAFIHQNLYQDDAANSVNMDAYIQTLATHLFQTYHISTGKIQFKMHIEPLQLHTDTAIPMGMILNELISNSLKYAFKNRASIIVFSKL